MSDSEKSEKSAVKTEVKMSKEELDKFIDTNDVDGNAATDLRNCPLEVQKIVLSRGDLSSARNPSAALIARIRDARTSVSSGHHVPGGSEKSGASVDPQVEEFIKSNKIDDSAAASLRGSPLDVQRAVLARGELTGARNPSSALLSRIRDAKAAPHNGALALPGPPGYAIAGMPLGAIPPPPGGYGYGGYPMPPPPPGYPPGYGYGQAAYYGVYGYPYGVYPGMPGYPAGPGYGDYGAPPGAKPSSRSHSRGRSKSRRRSRSRSGSPADQSSSGGSSSSSSSRSCSKPRRKKEGKAAAKTRRRKGRRKERARSKGRTKSKERAKSASTQKERPARKRKRSKSPSTQKERSRSPSSSSRRKKKRR